MKGFMKGIGLGLLIALLLAMAFGWIWLIEGADEMIRR